MLVDLLFCSVFLAEIGYHQSLGGFIQATVAAEGPNESCCEKERQRKQHDRKSDMHPKKAGPKNIME